MIRYKCPICGHIVVYTKKYYFANRDNISKIERLYCLESGRYENYVLIKENYRKKTMSKRFNLTVDLNSDEELRSYIKEMIDGQVKSVLRGELAELVKSKAVEILVNKKDYDRTISQAINTVIEREVKNSIYRIMNEKNPRNYFSLDGYIKNSIDEKIKSAIDTALSKVDIENVMRMRSEKNVDQLFDNMIKNNKKEK